MDEKESLPKVGSTSKDLYLDNLPLRRLNREPPGFETLRSMDWDLRRNAEQLNIVIRKPLGLHGLRLEGAQSKPEPLPATMINRNVSLNTKQPEIMIRRPLGLHRLSLEEKQSLPELMNADYFDTTRLQKKQNDLESIEEGRKLPTQSLSLQGRHQRRVRPPQEQQREELKNTLQDYYQSIEIDENIRPERVHTNK